MSQPSSKPGLTGLTLTEQDAVSLSHAAVRIDQARCNNNAKELALALDSNLELWIGIRTLVMRSGSPVPTAVRDNLVRLANFVAQATLDKGVQLAPDMLDSLININLQISEGLLEGTARRG